MPDYETWAARRDEAVDSMLGDNVGITVDGVALVLPPGSSRAGTGGVGVKAFVIFEHGGTGIEGIDELAQRKRLKIHKSLIPDPDEHDVLVTSAKLEGTWEPAGKFDEEGSYWLADLQRAP